MRDGMDLVWIVARDAITHGQYMSNKASASGVPLSCDSDVEYNGRLGLRISSIFVILIGSCLGAIFPIFASRNRRIGIPDWTMFVAKYFGSGVIIATAFIHLLAPANEALTSDCLNGPITAYPWVEGIALMTIFALFFVELMVMRAPLSHQHGTITQQDHSDKDGSPVPVETHDLSHLPGHDHLGHSRTHVDGDQYAAQMTAIFILEFGVVFHSVFIGLTLAVAGAEFVTLYIVLVFHQTFEGLGLGARLAEADWPPSRRWTPYILALVYGLSTPIAIAIGLGVRTSLSSQTGLIVNGVFDSISAGILIYTGLVELMAHEFMFNEGMRKASLSVILSAFGVMCLGAGLMALLGILHDIGSDNRGQGMHPHELDEKALQVSDSIE